MFCSVWRHQTRKIDEMEFVYLADYPEALELVAKWYYNQWGRQHGMKSVKTSKEILSDYLNRDSIPLIILARKNSEFLGAVQLKYYEMDIYPNKEHWLGGVFIPPKYRGKKIARKLVLHASEIAKSQGVNILYLQTERMDGGLYKQLGWKPIEHANYRGKNVLVMKKKL